MVLHCFSMFSINIYAYLCSVGQFIACVCFFKASSGLLMGSHALLSLVRHCCALLLLLLSFCRVLITSCCVFLACIMFYSNPPLGVETTKVHFWT